MRDMSADIVLTEDTLRYISLFEAITKNHVTVKDCMDTEDKLVFVVGVVGPGATLMMNSIKRFVPMSRLPLAQKIGIISRFATPSFKPERISS